MKKLLIIVFLSIPSLASSALCTVFAHGIVDGPEQAQRFQEAFATSHVIAPEFPDRQPASGWGLNNATYQITSLLGKKVNRNAMFMGQEADIEIISHAITNTSPDQSIVLYGCSRGAAAILTYLGQHNPTNIAALVLDACPANMPETIHPKLAQLGIAPSMANRIFSKLFPQYNPEKALTPEMAIKKIHNKKLPILLIHSTCDTVVHHTHTLRLYQQLLQEGFTNVHMVLISIGRHSFLLQNPIAQTKYLQAVHSFYKKYNLNYNQAWAQSEIPTMNLSLEAIKQEIDNHKRMINIQYLQAFRRNITISGAIIMILSYYFHPAPVPLQYITQTFWK